MQIFKMFMGVCLDVDIAEEFLIIEMMKIKSVQCLNMLSIGFD